VQALWQLWSQQAPDYSTALISALREKHLKWVDMVGCCHGTAACFKDENLEVNWAQRSTDMPHIVCQSRLAMGFYIGFGHGVPHAMQGLLLL